jgi:prephenate dehydrogenase
MLQDATFFLAASTETSERAINTAAGLAEALGSQPYFVAPDELDSLIAAGSQMPFMAAMSMMSAWQHTSGWQDRQHALGASTRWITDMLTDSSEDQESGLWENRDYIDEWLERVISAMQTWRERLQSQDSSSLDAAITSVRQNAWAREPEDQTTTIDNGELAGFRQLFMGSLGRRGKGKR